MTPPAPTPSQSTRSTVLNHSLPPFYACYLLQSYSDRKGIRGRTYIGSTPDPPRRWKQHNGNIKGGAFKTRMGRPWEMELIVYGFPSKLQALQFEWAWQNPHASRHLHIRPSSSAPPPSTPVPSTALFPKSTLSNKPTTKVQVLQYMLTVPPWSHFDLKVMKFGEIGEGWWNEALAKGSVVGTGKAKMRMRDGWGDREEKVLSVETTKRLDGVDGLRLKRREGGIGELIREKEPSGEESDEEAQAIKIAVDDYDFARPQWTKWEAVASSSTVHRCNICDTRIEHEDHLAFLVCAAESTSCNALFHLPCLAKHFLGNSPAHQVLPTNGKCPACREKLHWQQLIRAAFRRSEAAVGKGLGKVKGRRTKKGAKATVEKESSEDEEEDEDVFAFEEIGEESEVEEP